MAGRVKAVPKSSSSSFASCNGRHERTQEGSRKEKIQLVKYEDAPSFLQENQYIWTGYRTFLPPNLCIKSVFMWTNETVNIWSHIIAFGVYFAMMLYNNFYILPSLGGDLWDHVVVTLGLLCAQFCMLASAGFHTFNCQSDGQYCKWLALDTNGVAISIGGGHLTGIYYLFYCDAFTSRIYMILTMCILLAIVLISSLNCPVIYRKSEFLMHAAKVVAFVAYGAIPTSHFIMQNGWSSEYVQHVMPRICIFYVLLIFSLLVYVGRVPECYFPGKVDYFGQSHNWWHLMVAVSGASWYINLPEVIAYSKEHVCIWSC